MADVLTEEQVARLWSDGGPYTRIAESHEQIRAQLAAALERAERAERNMAVWEKRTAEATLCSARHLEELAASMREAGALRAGEARAERGPWEKRDGD